MEGHEQPSSKSFQDQGTRHLPQRPVFDTRGTPSCKLRLEWVSLCALGVVVFSNLYMGGRLDKLFPNCASSLHALYACSGSTVSHRHNCKRSHSWSPLPPCYICPPCVVVFYICPWSWQAGAHGGDTATEWVRTRGCPFVWRNGLEGRQELVPIYQHQSWPCS